MGLYKRKNSQFYWMSYKVNGKRLYESTGTTSKKLANKIYAKCITEITEGKWFSNQAVDLTILDLEERYMTEYSAINKAPSSSKRDVYSFKHLKSFFEDKHLKEITPARIAEYKSKRRIEGAKTATIAKELEVLRNALNKAVNEWEWLEKNPFSRVKIEKANNKVERWLTTEEEEKLLASSEQWLREILVFTLNTGMRRGEVISIKWSQIDLLRQTVTLLETKNGEKRTIPLNQTVDELLRAKSKVKHITGHVFLSKEGSPLIGSNLLKALQRSVKFAGIEHLRFHDLRHTFATRLVQAGIDLYVVKELLGHKTLSMTMRYAHHYPESLRHGVDVLDKNGDILVTLGKKRGAAQLGDSSQAIEMA